MIISTLVFVCPDQGLLKRLKWLQLWRSHISSKITTKIWLELWRLEWLIMEVKMARIMEISCFLQNPNQECYN